MENTTEIILFETEDKSIILPVEIDDETVWLSANQMATLFDRDEKTIRKHINIVFAEEEVDKNNNTQKMRVECPFFGTFATLKVLKEIIISQRVTSLDNHIRLISPQDNCPGVFFIEL